MSHELYRSQQYDAVPKKKGRTNAGCWVHDAAADKLALPGFGKAGHKAKVSQLSSKPEKRL